MSWQSDYARYDEQMGEAQTGATLGDALGFFVWLAVTGAELLCAIGLLYLGYLGLKAALS